MKKQIITLVLFLSVNLVSAQNQANNWYFGSNAGITFSTNPPTMLSGGLLNTIEYCATISDGNGNMLFYSDGVFIWDSNHSLMQNSITQLGNNSSTQGIIIPAPGSATLYYLITTPFSNSFSPLAYSIVDMTLNSGLGAVTINNDTLLAVSTEKVTAVNHQNGTDIWIIAHGYPNNNFYAFLLTSAGINPVPVVTSAGNPITIPQYKTGYLKASPCGNQLAMVNYNGSGTSTLELFDFDNLTGVVSNANQLGSWTGINGMYGVEFSPDESKLYASSISPPYVVQYDLLAGSPATIIASMDTITISPSIYFGALQLGPDGKIYLSKPNENILACITNPNQQGSLCGYIENYVALGTGFCKWGLPGFLSSIFCNIPSSTNSITYEHTISIYPILLQTKFQLMFKNKIRIRQL